MIFDLFLFLYLQGEAMRSVFRILSLLIILPMTVLAQQSKPQNDCPISHWSTTGAACDYAPDMPSVRDSELKSGYPDQIGLIQTSNTFLDRSSFHNRSGYDPRSAPNQYRIVVPPDMSDSLLRKGRTYFPDSLRNQIRNLPIK